MCYIFFVSDEKKEKVLHTRVPAVLERELKDLAKNLRLPVSRVVRTILEDAVTTVDRIGKRANTELTGVASLFAEEGAASPSPSPSPPSVSHPLKNVIGYQALRLVRDGECALSGERLPRGSDAYLAIRSDGAPGVLLSPDCLPMSARQALGLDTPTSQNTKEEE